MEAAICALGYQSEQIQYVIHQMVKLIKDGEELKLSKRTGKAYTLKGQVSKYLQFCYRLYFPVIQVP